jgi:hypothetical protein
MARDLSRGRQRDEYLFGCGVRTRCQNRTAHRNHQAVSRGARPCALLGRQARPELTEWSLARSCAGSRNSNCADQMTEPYQKTPSILTSSYLQQCLDTPAGTSPGPAPLPPSPRSIDGPA